MKRVDFGNGRTLSNIAATALPMFAAQALNLLYNIVDRIYIARIPVIGTAALGAVGLCFPIVILITAFTNMFGSGGAPLFSISRGAGDRKEASGIQNTSFFLLLVTAILLTLIGELAGAPVLRMFGASDQAMVHALPYLRIYLIGHIDSANVEGAAIATILSQALSAVFVLFFLFGNKVDYRLHCLRPDEIRSCGPRARRITGLGMAAFIMQLTNSLVTVSCNQVLSHVGGDIYVSIMTIINSARQMLETPLLSITEGTSPIISFNYGARRFKDVKEAGLVMFLLSMGYAGAVWMILRICPAAVIGIFSSDPELMETALPSFNLYFSTFIFMVFQHCGQIVFKSLGKKNHAIFFSLLRKAFIVIPLTYLLPYAFHMGTAGVFAAEPISNVVGGLACFITMLIVVLPELK